MYEVIYTGQFRKSLKVCVRLSKTIVFGEEVGSLPINNFSLGFFFGMDIGLVKHHDVFVFQVVERPHFCFAIGSLLCRERWIASFGELYPHFAHGL